ncbi:MAG TPA: pilin [Patescibacteria group bacterium]
MKKVLSFVLAFFLFLVIPSKAFAQSCTIEYSWTGGGTHTIEQNFETDPVHSDITLPFYLPITFTIRLNNISPEDCGGEGDGKYFVQFEKSRTGSADFGGPIYMNSCNGNTASLVVAPTFTAEAFSDGLDEDLQPTRGIRLRVQQDHRGGLYSPDDKECWIEFGLSRDNYFQEHRQEGNCEYPVTCGGGTGKQLCVGQLLPNPDRSQFNPSEFTCQGPTEEGGVNVASGESFCTQCQICNVTCYPGCESNQFNEDGSENPFYASECADNLQPICGNDICEAGEGTTAISWNGGTQNECDQDCTNPGVPYEICNQLAEGPAKESCLTCSRDNSGIWTAVGCIQVEEDLLLGTIVTIAVGMAGGVALLMILSAGFMFTTSQGDPKKTSEAKELMTSAVVGLLFIIFSVSVLQLIGMEILKIPGFGG